MRGKIQDILLGVLCEIETEVNSVQLDDEIFLYEILFTDLIVHTR